MTMKITIGTDVERDTKFVLPPDVVTSTQVVYGGKGMGKTNFGAVLVEELVRVRLRWSVLDPMGVWWGLRHSRDGKGPGVECLILGGPHGDIPIEPTGGAVVADLVADEDANVIIDFSRKPTGETWGVGEKTRFVTDYGKRIFERQGSLVNNKRREPLFQMIDEAARFIPQMIRAGDPQLAMCLSVWAQIAEEGRNFGLGVCFLTQRSARLNKDVAELADAMLAFRTIGPNSVGAIIDWLGEHVAKEHIKAVVEKVRSLPVGRCLVVSPGWLEFEGIVQVRARETFDSSATPKPGESTRKVTGAAAKPDLAKYAERMKETIERAKENDPRALKNKIAELQRELTKKKPAAAPAKAAAPDKSIVDRAIAHAITLRDKQWRSAVGANMKLIGDRLRALSAEFNPKGFAEPERFVASADDVGLAREASRPVRAGIEAAGQPLPRGDGTTKQNVVTARRDERSAADVAGTNGDLSAGEHKVLDVLAELEALGVSEPHKAQVSLMSGYSNPRSGGFREPIARLIDRSFITYPSPGTLKLTHDGRAHAKEVSAPMTAEEVLDRLKRTLPSSDAKVLDELAGAYPNAVNKAVLAERCGYSNVRSGGFREPLARLRALGAIDYRTPDTAQLSPWVMLEGE